MNRNDSLLLRVFSSFGLSATIFAFLTLITWLGTLAQEELGLFRAQQKYFESFVVVQSLFDLPLPGGNTLNVRVPLPGGMTLILVLFINVVVGGMVRLRLRKRNVGVLITHVGIVFLLISGGVKTYFADEGGLTLYEGDEAAHYVSYHDWEIVVEEAQEPLSALRDAEVPVRQWLLYGAAFERAAGDRTVTLRAEDLPFTLTLAGFTENARVREARGASAGATPAVDGYRVVPLAPEKQNERNAAACYARIEPTGSGEASRTGILWALSRAPWTVAVDERRFAITLRRKRFEMPFKIHLDDFIHEYHPNTRMPREFQSQVTVFDGDEEVPVRIRMNEPLRREGMIVFQSNWGPTNAGPGDPLYSGFSVVRNPADQWPYYALWVITAGMLIHFVMRLWRYLMQQLGRPA